MKKLLLATAISALTIGAAQAAPTVYGKLHVSVDNIDKRQGATGSDNLFQVNSNASRFGVKGDEKLTDNLSAIYLAEWEVSTDGDDISGVGSSDGKTTGVNKGDGSKLDLTQRNRYVGLKYAGVGAVKVGKFDTYVRTSQGKVDYFNDMFGLDMKTILTGENRVNNVVALESDAKALGGLGFNVLLQQGEGAKLAGDNSEDKSESIGDAVSASIVYDNKDLGIYAAVAGDKNIVNSFVANGKKAEAEVIRLVGSLDMEALASVPGLTLNALLQTAKPTNLSTTAKAGDFKGFDKEQSFLVGAGYKIGDTPWSVKVQYQQSNTEYTTAGTEDTKLAQIGGMVDYAFNSKTRAYGYVAQQTDDRKVAGKDKDDLNFVGMGLEFNF